MWFLLCFIKTWQSISQVHASQLLGLCRSNEAHEYSSCVAARGSCFRVSRLLLSARAISTHPAASLFCWRSSFVFASCSQTDWPRWYPSAALIASFTWISLQHPPTFWTPTKSADCLYLSSSDHAPYSFRSRSLPTSSDCRSMPEQVLFFSLN